jgi:hypothetical protein
MECKRRAALKRAIRGDDRKPVSELNELLGSSMTEITP